MSENHVLVCRGCGTDETFQTLRTANKSEWREISIYGIVMEMNHREHHSLCPEYPNCIPSEGTQDDEASRMTQYYPSTRLGERV